MSDLYRGLQIVQCLAEAEAARLEQAIITAIIGKESLEQGAYPRSSQAERESRKIIIETKLAELLNSKAAVVAAIKHIQQLTSDPGKLPG